MTLQDLFNEKLIKEIEFVSIRQIRNRFILAIKFYNTAKELFRKDKEEEISQIIYTNLYDSTRILGETFLLLNGYKAERKDHHKIVIQAVKIIMDDSNLEEIFKRLDSMRKNRNDIDYDIITPLITKQDLKQSIEDIKKYADKIEKYINKKDPQKKLME